MSKKKAQEELTKKQEEFVQNVIKGMSQREAYRAVYGCKGWKPESIDTQASKLLKTPKVYSRYRAIYDQVVAQSAKNTIITAEKILAEMAAVAFSDQKTFIDVDKRSGRRISLKKNFEELDTRAIQEIRFDKAGNPIIKLYDKNQVLLKLCEIYGVTQKTEAESIEIVYGVEEEYKN